MDEDRKKRRRSVGKLQKRGGRPQTIRGRQGAVHQKTADTREQRLQQQLEASRSENCSLRSELVNERSERWHTVQIHAPMRAAPPLNASHTSKGALSNYLLTRVVYLPSPCVCSRDIARMMLMPTIQAMDRKGTGCRQRAEAHEPCGVH